jgi:HEAT repeat protein
MTQPAIQRIRAGVILTGLLGVSMVTCIAAQQQQTQGSAAKLATKLAKKPASAAKPPVPKRPIEETAWNLLSEAAVSQKESQKTSAITALSSIGPRPEVVGLIEPALTDKDATIRRLAVTALGELKARTSIPKLKEALDDKSASVSFAAARALWEMGDHGGRDIFIEVLTGKRAAGPGVVQGQIDEARRQLHSPMALAMIGLEQGAGAFLGPGAMGITVIEAFARDKSASARAISASLLGADRDPDSFHELEAALTDKNWGVRVAAAKALGNSTQHGVIAKLRPIVLNDKEKEIVRYMAAASVVRLRPPKTAPATSGAKPGA